MNIPQFEIEEVRCFADRQRFNIRPLTFLIGENSTGKTTTLACFQIMADYLKRGDANFNSFPYSMGIFREIVRKSKRSEKSFSIGAVLEGEENVEVSIKFSKSEESFEPVVQSVFVGFDGGEIIFEVSRSEHEVEGPLVKIRKTEHNRFHVKVYSAFWDRRPLFSNLEGYAYRIRSELPVDSSDLTDYLEKKFKSNKSLRKWSLEGPATVISSSPIRSLPRRTYDPTSQYNDPEGSDIPMLLLRLHTGDKNLWEALKRELVEFGKSSGLFHDISINTLGGPNGGPFQLRVKVRGPNSNITDVGYGVSQILPILVRILLHSFLGPGVWGDPENAYFLLQQPEVHLHPKAQAELSSLLAKLANYDNQSFVIETHSDYMVDRARIEIRRGNISADDVSLIFLEPTNNVVNVHNITFDRMGNMIGAPPAFRDFFLLESDRLMGFED